MSRRRSRSRWSGAGKANREISATLTMTASLEMPPMLAEGEFGYPKRCSNGKHHRGAHGNEGGPLAAAWGGKRGGAHEGPR